MYDIPASRNEQKLVLVFQNLIFVLTSTRDKMKGKKKKVTGTLKGFVCVPHLFCIFMTLFIVCLGLIVGGCADGCCEWPFADAHTASWREDEPLTF